MDTALYLAARRRGITRLPTVKALAAVATGGLVRLRAMDHHSLFPTEPVLALGRRALQADCFSVDCCPVSFSFALAKRTSAG